MAIISISGKINSGKDLTGRIIKILLESPQLTPKGVMTFLEKGLYNNSGEWQIKKFADKLKDIVCLLIGCTREQLEDREFKEKELGEEWTKYQYYSADQPNVEMKMTPRLLLQLLGTECGRQIIHPNIWVNALMSEYKKYIYAESISGTSEVKRFYKYPNWIITDMRFPNELKAVKDKGGITIRVNREIKHQVETLGGRTNVLEGHFPTNQHESETALDESKFDYFIENNGTIEELIQKVKEVLIKEKII